MKKITIGLMVIAMGTMYASADVVLSKDVRGATTWDAFTIKTFDSTQTGISQLTIKDNATTGVGQSFTSTASGNVDAISLAVLRMYAGLDGVINVYQMFDGDGTTPGANPTRFRNGNSDWMSGAISTINFNTTSVNINNSGDGNDMYTFNLTGADQFAVTAGATYMVQIAGTVGGSGGNLVLWDKVDAGTYANGTYGVPDGGTTTVGGRDGGLAVNVIPEPATFGLVAVFGGAVLFVRRRFMI